MSKTQLIYIHGGEAFDQFLPGLKSSVVANLKKLYKTSSTRWPDQLHKSLPSFEILKLSMPGKYNAKYESWKKHFESHIKDFEDEIILLGWSLGANFLAKYLNENHFPKPIKSLHLVAGCYGCPGGFGLHRNLENIEKQVPHIHLYHSRDDFVVDFADFKKYQKALPQAQSHIFDDRNHFLQPDFPELWKNLSP